jgi:hypothetical protein
LFYAFVHKRSNIDLPPILSLYYDVQSPKGPNVRRSITSTSKNGNNTSKNDSSTNALSKNDISINDVSFDSTYVQENVTDDDLLENFTTG